MRQSNAIELASDLSHKDSWLYFAIKTIQTPICFPVTCRQAYEPLVHKVGCTGVCHSDYFNNGGGTAWGLPSTVHELQTKIRALHITQFMCSAWMKPVCTHTMGHGHKTVHASPILAGPVCVEVTSSKNALSIDPPGSFVLTSHSWNCGYDV